MQCLVVTAPYHIELQERPVPVPKEGEALLRVHYGGICGSDLGLYRGTMHGYATYPRIPGHEIAAEILSLPEETELLKVGTQVTVNPYFNCGTCYSCRRGYVNCCVHNQTMGLSRDGGFSEYLTMPVERLYPGNGVPLKLLAMVEPFCVGYHAVKRAGVRPGDHVLIVGAGMIGFSAMLAAKLMGGYVTVSNRTPGKLKIAEMLGADATVLDEGEGRFSEQIRELTDGAGYDVLIEATGQPFAVQNCVDAAAHRARIVEVGITNTPMEFLFNQIEKKELELLGSRNAMPEDFWETIGMIQNGKLDLEPLLTEIVPLEKAQEKFAEIESMRGGGLKTLIQFS